MKGAVVCRPAAAPDTGSSTQFMANPSKQLTSLPEISAGAIASGTLAVMAVAAAFWLLFRHSSVAIILFAAIVISTAIRPGAERLAHLRLPRPYNVVAVYTIVGVGLFALAALAAPTLSNQVARIADELPGAYQTIREDMVEHRNFLVWRVATALPETLEETTASVAEENGGTEAEPTANPLATAGAIGRGVFTVVALLVLSYYWTLDGPRIQQSLLLRLPPSRRARVRDLVEGAQKRLSAFVMGQLLLSSIVGTMALVAYLLIDLPNALLLAVFAAIGEAIPLIGPGLGAIPAALLAYSIEPVKALWVIVATLVIQQVEANLLVPRVMYRAVGLHPIVSIVSLMAFGLLFGVAGALVAIPFAAIVQYLVGQWLEDRSSVVVPGGRDHKSRLRYEAQEVAQDVRKRMRQGRDELDETEMEVADILERIAVDLESLLAGRDEEEGSAR